MRKVIMCAFLVQILIIPVLAQDNKTTEPPSEKVETVSASDLEKLEEEKAGTIVKEEEPNSELQEEDEVEEEEIPETGSYSSTEDQEKSTVSKNSNDTYIAEQDNKNSSTKKNKSSFSDEDKDTLIRWCLIIFTLWSVYKIIIYRYKRKCDDCGKWNSMKVIKEELVDQKISSITEIRKVKDREGNVIQSREVDVPATVYTYHIHRRCKHCGYQDILSKEEKRKN